MSLRTRKVGVLFGTLAFIFAAYFLLPSDVHADLPTISAQFSKNHKLFGPKYSLEIASNPSTRMVGLMYRQELPPDNGMIFIFPSEKRRAFWMKNTYVSLDMIFLDRHKIVQGIIENSIPLSTRQLSLEPEVESMYVVELVAGSAQKIGISPGDILVSEGELPGAADKD